MADAGAAQQNAVTRVFGVDSEFVYLMCFYHVMTKVHENLKGIPGRLSEQVMADIYGLHFAASQDVYDEQLKQILTKWSGEEQLVWFQGYLSSVTPIIFKEFPEATQQLNARIKNFCRRDLLVDMTPSRSSIEFLLVSPNPDVVRVSSHGCERVYLPEPGRSREVAPVSAQMGVNYARMEVVGQPEGCWHVNLSTNSCGCNYYFKFEICVHVLFALQIKDYTGLDGKRTLVNRSVSK
ncbi:hypothetical protein F441_18964 [Phytophthora nicotianae CJ01A1]|uniref:SWIM-type domain-containing protein n=1 Tax=Phytophthora nicotianae CJ01A1 TaxID=1317063 RepID=W2W2I0_PHYNI|nr:hypothetical protein F441_18964 [Phytophthora nicotianae CJ01A1]